MIYWRTLIAACLFGSTLIGGAAPAQTLRIGLATDPDTLDPTLSRAFVSFIVRAALCDSYSISARSWRSCRSSPPNGSG